MRLFVRTKKYKNTPTGQKRQDLRKEMAKDINEFFGYSMESLSGMSLEKLKGMHNRIDKQKKKNKNETK